MSQVKVCIFSSFKLNYLLVSKNSPQIFVFCDWEPETILNHKFGVSLEKELNCELDWNNIIVFGKTSDLRLLNILKGYLVKAF